MSAYIELNIKEGMPTTFEAVDYLKNSFNQYRCNKYKCVLVIHGYGSTGKGGAICNKARQWLKAQERAGKVKNIIFGEDFSIFNPKTLELKNRYHELEPLIKVCNHGVTIVEL